ncbi:RagB/SusD family nutrient uptake outer membrane protein [Chitinophaga horti]|uniref:RagB/SusD family nutrient uptake outer membrane protein n=1 Tax=Chitinophaga horti TaxID=2920382 RepID=A0ABY6J0V3_9BACT|nr:RagB/SusD family nutrient uptake outer membrane protein [Chitinophaga horti]UYQ91772.1 RagB/SusD family nutrient uptake outer membrane protein [Chitinophaga horti]
MKQFHTRYNIRFKEICIRSVKTNIVITSLISIFCLSLWSCKDFLDIDPPKNRLITKSVFNTGETANAAVLNIYSAMGNPYESATTFSIAALAGLSADELNTFAGTEAISQVHVNDITPAGAATNTIWNNAYLHIFKANAVIEGCSASTNLISEVKQQLIGEGQFIRAFWYFYLINLYGDVPLALSTEYTTNRQLLREKKATVYGQIISDLLAAQANLSENYVGFNGTSITQERVRPNKSAATALLARVYLFTEQYSKAEEQATTIISKSATYSLASLDSVFLKNNKEAIWQLMVTSPNDVNTSEGFGFILTSPPNISSLNNSNTISSNLLGVFDIQDSRKEHWINTYTDASVTPNVEYSFPAKYKVKTGSEVTEYSTILRLGEQYLIRAEARAQQNDIANAVADLDEIRGRAGLPSINATHPNIQKAALLNAILVERQLELFTEWGHRWLDIKRTKLIDEVMTHAALEKGATWDTRKQLWPIPPAEIQNKLNQNLSYN